MKTERKGMIFRNQSESIGKMTGNDRKRLRKWVIQLGVEE